MNDAHCAVRRVDALTSSTPRLERVDAKILRIDVDVELQRKTVRERTLMKRWRWRWSVPPLAEAG